MNKYIGNEDLVIINHSWLGIMPDKFHDDIIKISNEHYVGFILESHFMIRFTHHGVKHIISMIDDQICDWICKDANIDKSQINEIDESIKFSDSFSKFFRKYLDKIFKKKTYSNVDDHKLDRLTNDQSFMKHTILILDRLRYEHAKKIDPNKKNIFESPGSYYVTWIKQDFLRFVTEYEDDTFGTQILEIDWNKVNHHYKTKYIINDIAIAQNHVLNKIVSDTTDKKIIDEFIHQMQSIKDKILQIQ